MFGDRKTAHIAAYLLRKAEGSRLELGKLMKLMYLADREALKQTKEPLSDDRFVRGQDGPVLLHTGKLMSGEASIAGEWEALIERVGSGAAPWIALRNPVDEEELDELSPRTCRILNEVWDEFGDREPSDLSGYARTLPEWDDAAELLSEMPLVRMLEAVGHSKEMAEGLAKFHAEQRLVDQALAEIQYGSRAMVTRDA